MTTTFEPTTSAILVAAEHMTGTRLARLYRTRAECHARDSLDAAGTRAPANLPEGALVISPTNPVAVVRAWCERHRYMPRIDNATGKVYAVPMPRLVTDGGQRVAP